MKTFRDGKGTEWLVVVDVNGIKRCRNLLGVDLYTLVDDGFQGLAKLLNDPVQLCDVVYVLCRDEAEKRGVSDEDFGRAMWGDAIGAAADAFLEAYTDFFRDPRVRAGITKMMATVKAAYELMMRDMGDRLGTLDPEAEARRFIDSSGNSPGSSASTPAPSRSAN